MSTDAAKFMFAGGIGDVAAKILADQIDADEPSADVLCRSGVFPDFLAVKIAAAIKSGVVDTLELANFGLNAAMGSALLRAVTEKYRGQK